MSLFTRPVNAVGIEAHIRITPMGIRAPNLSQTGPLTKRIKMVPATEQMLDVQICCLSIPKLFPTSLSRGAMANQIKKAIKKDHHEQWKALMCGLEKSHNLISLARSSWLGSTLRT
mmetsp:Transcript_2639/g.3513  ORF Transcript_2639/g.3513 Transcript_2639/m.3513 type:complete len:116 (-) Transcript_2639:207-554(-)